MLFDLGRELVRHSGLGKVCTKDTFSLQSLGFVVQRNDMSILCRVLVV